MFIVKFNIREAIYLSINTIKLVVLENQFYGLFESGQFTQVLLYLFVLERIFYKTYNVVND